MSHASISAPGPSSNLDKPKKRARLTAEGMNMREEFRKSLGGRRATIGEKKAIVARIQKLPGCEWYSINNINSCLASHANNATVETNFGTISAKRFATLTPQVRNGLSSLLAMEETPPTESKVKLWAGMVQATGAIETDVVDWVIWQQIQMHKQQKTQGAATSKNDRLPTPAHTASPEPTPTTLRMPLSPTSSSVKSPMSPISPLSPMPSVGSPVLAYSGPHSYYNRDANATRQPEPVIVSPLVSVSTSQTQTQAQTQFQAQEREAGSSRQGSISVQAHKRDRSESMSISRATSPTGMSLPPTRFPSISARSPRAQSQHLQLPAPERPLPTLRDLIMQGVAEAKTTTISLPGQLPRSPTELNELFASYESRFTYLIQALEP